MKCDEGYRCDVCGQDVEAIVDSALYLRFVLGEAPLETLHLQRERHIRCDASLAQYIVDDRFESIACPTPFGKQFLDGDFVAAEEARITRGWRRLQELPHLGLTIAEYPLDP